MRTLYALIAVLALGSALAAEPLQPASAPAPVPVPRLAAAENLHPTTDPSASVPQAPPASGTVVRVPSDPEQAPAISAVVTSTDQFVKRDASCASSPITKCCSAKVKSCCHTSCFGDVSPWVDLAPREAGPWQNTRLPTDILPSAYDISIQTDVASSNVIGTVVIDANVVRATRYVIVHSWRQNLTNISITTGTAAAPRAVAIKDAYFFPNLDYFIVLTESELPPGPCRITIGFSSKLAKIAIGFFKTQYRKPGGATSVMASTHFEALYARRAFPCFDEPAMKAVFTVSLTVPTEMVALSNMPVVKEQPASPAYSTTKAPVTWKRVQFAPSVRMSSYLVAFSICDFAFAEVIFTRPNSTSTVPIRVYAPPHLVEHTQYALKSAVNALQYFEDKFRIPYALPKVDMIALPDFKTGSSAMENWGLVTFTQHRLIYNLNRPSSARKHALTSTLTHEIAHQWFGNLVTMKWWNDLWLNEGFATFADFTALNVLKPKWKRFEALLLRTRKAFLFDSLDAARPLHAEVGGRLHEVNVLFDGISYAKGCAIVRMVQDFLTVNGDMEPFFAGLRRYLGGFKFNNAEDTDLWSSLRDSLKERNIELDVPEIMATWTRQAGYPYITVSNGAKGEVQVSQARFRLAPEDPTVSNHSDRWNVPITYVTRKFPKWRRLHWLPASEGSSTISLVVPPNAASSSTADDDTILLANPGQKGFYRVNYEPSHWDYLAKLLKKRPTVFDPIDRAGLLDDAFEFGRSGTLDYGTILDLTQFLRNERSYVPWVVAFEGFFFVRTRLLNSEVSKPLKKYVLSKIQPLLRRLGPNTKRAFKQSGPRTRFLRSLAFTAALVYGDKRVRAEAKQYWEIFQKNPRKALRKIPGPISVAILRNGIETGGRKEFNLLWKMLKRPRKYRIRKTALLIALAHSRSPKLLSKVLHATLNTKKFKGRDRLTTMLAVSRTPRGAGAVLDFLMKHYNSTAIQDLPLAAVLKKALSNLDTKERLDQFSDFFSKQPRTAGTRTFCQVKELIRANQKWVPQNEEKVCLWLKAKGFYPNGTCN